MIREPTRCDGEDWLVVGRDDGSRESAVPNLQPESSRQGPGGGQRGLEASQTQENQTLDGPNTSEKGPHALCGEQEPYPTQAIAKQQDGGLSLKLLVWYDGLETPIELLDRNQKPLVVTANRSCSTHELLKVAQEMVVMQPQLQKLFPQVTRENVGEVLQVCQRSADETQWVPLSRKSKNYEEMELRKDSSPSELQLTPQFDRHGETQCFQLLVESKAEAGREGELTDWRRGRFYSDIQKNAWRFELQMGQLVDALDTNRRWYESRIVDMDAVYVKVHYRGWTSKWDEWVRRTSERLAPLHTKVPNWRAFQVGDRILVGSEVPGKRYPEWRHARVTACDFEDGALQIEVDVDGNKKWFHAQDELLCPKGTHKAVNTSAKRDPTTFSVPHSLLFNYFERPEERPPSSARKEELVNEVESVREATHAMQLAESDTDGDEWCVVDDNDNADRGEESTHRDSNERTDATVAESEVLIIEGDIRSALADAENNTVRKYEQSRREILTPTVGQIFTTTAEVLDGKEDRRISEEDAWRYQLEIDQLIDARDTDNVWYESRVVALSSTLVKLHYRGWTSKWDEWIERTSTRIAPLHTKVRNWRAFKKGDAVMVGHSVATKRYPEWRNAVVSACEACEVDGRLRIEVNVDGCKEWMDAQDEMLCPPGTHKATNSSMLKHMVQLF